MTEVYRKFLHNGPRSATTDKIAEELGRHAVSDTWPEAEDITVWWIQDKADWFVYAVGNIPEKEGTT